MGNYEDARRFNSKYSQASGRVIPVRHVVLITIGLLLEKEPSNLQAQSLDALINQAVTKGVLRSILSRRTLNVFSRWIHWNGSSRRCSGRWYADHRESHPSSESPDLANLFNLLRSVRWIFVKIHRLLYNSPLTLCNEQ